MESEVMRCGERCNDSAAAAQDQRVPRPGRSVRLFDAALVYWHLLCNTVF